MELEIEMKNQQLDRNQQLLATLTSLYDKINNKLEILTHEEYPNLPEKEMSNKESEMETPRASTFPTYATVTSAPAPQYSKSALLLTRKKITKH